MDVIVSKQLDVVRERFCRGVLGVFYVEKTTEGVDNIGNFTCDNKLLSY